LQHPSVPCDAQPELEDVAISAARFEEATGVAVKQISHRWAGLRVFARDRSPIVGFDPRQSGFFWLAGQGGYGIQTAPALAEIVSHLITQSELPENFVQAKPAIGEMKPDRFIENAPLTVNRL